MLLLKQDNTKKKQMNKLLSMLEFETSDNKKYEIEAIWDSAIYTKETDRHLLGLYYLVAWKGYLEKKNTWELSSVVMQFWKMVSIFYKDYPKKPIAISELLDSTLPITKPKIKLSMKQK